MNIEFKGFRIAVRWVVTPGMCPKVTWRHLFYFEEISKLLKNWVDSWFEFRNFFEKYRNIFFMNGGIRFFHKRITEIRLIEPRQQKVRRRLKNFSPHFFTNEIDDHGWKKTFLTSSGFFDLLHLWIRRNILRLAEV